MKAGASLYVERHQRMLWQLVEANEARAFATLLERDRRLLEVGVGRGVDVTELIWVPISDWEPTALDLDHDSMALFECVHRFV